MEYGIRDSQQAAAKKATSERVYTALANNTNTPRAPRVTWRW